MWRCNCIVCRVLVHPVIRRVSHPTSSVTITEPSESIETPISEEVRTAPEAPPLTPQVVSQPQQPTEHQQPQHQPTVVEVKLPPELVERMSKLDENIASLRKDLTELSESIKSMVVEFKEFFAESTSPFNLLREPQRRGNGNGKGGGGRGGVEGRVAQVRITPTSFFEVLKVAYSMLSRMSKEQVSTIVESYVKVGLVDEDTGKALNVIIDLAENMRKHGLSPEDQLPYLYALIQALNVGDRSLTEYMLRELIKHGKGV